MTSKPITSIMKAPKHTQESSFNGNDYQNVISSISLTKENPPNHNRHVYTQSVGTDTHFGYVNDSQEVLISDTFDLYVHDDHPSRNHGVERNANR